VKEQFNKFNLSSSLFDFAYALSRIFGVLYIYLISGHSMVMAIGSLGLMGLLDAFLLSFLSKPIGKMGVRTSLIIATILYFLSSLALFPMTVANFPTTISIWIITSSFAKAFYYIAYHYYVLKLTQQGIRGKEISYIFALSTLLGIIPPYLGAILSDKFGLPGLAIVSAGFFLLSIIPLLSIENFKFTYTGKILKILDIHSIKKEFRLSLIYQVQNQESFWQIYVFILLGSSFISFGELFTLTYLISMVITFILGRFLDHHNRMKVLKIDGVFQSIGWLLRFAAQTPLGLIVADIYMKLSNQVLGQTLTTVTYDLLTYKNKNEDQILDEKIVAREIALNTSLFITAVVSVVTFTLFSFQGVFVLAIIASVVFSLI